MSSKKLNIMSLSIEPDLQELLKEHAKKKSMSVSEFVRKWLDKYPFHSDNVIPVVLDVPEALTRNREELTSFFGEKESSHRFRLMRLNLIPVADFPKEVMPTPTANLIEVYEICLRLQQLCLQQKVAGVSAIQAGIPYQLSVLQQHPSQDWRYYLNYSYKPISDEMQNAIVRFVNVETDCSRYFIVKRYKHIEYRFQELIIEAQPRLIERVGTDNDMGVFIQNDCVLLTGKYPHKDGEEFWFRPYGRR